MTQQGWHGFLAAEGLGDWVVLHGGATAVFRVESLDTAAQLAGAIANVPGIAGGGVLLTLSDTHVTVRLSRDLWNLEPRHIELARAVSAVARQQAAVPDRATIQEVQVAVAAKSEEIDLDFWRAVLGYAPMADDNRSIRSGIARQSGCRRSTRESHCATRCISTFLSRANTSRRGSRQR